MFIKSLQSSLHDSLVYGPALETGSGSFSPNPTTRKTRGAWIKMSIKLNDYKKTIPIHNNNKKKKKRENREHKNTYTLKLIIQ